MTCELLRQHFTRLQQAFAKNPMPSAAERSDWLEQLRQALIKQQDAIADAISQDFGHRSADETRMVELLPSVLGIAHARRNLKRWMRPQRRWPSLLFQPSCAKVYYQPVGVVGIVVPWNSPVFLSIGPLTSALAAGNRVMLKMSEHAPATAKLMQQLLQSIFPQDLVNVVLGDAQLGKAFTQLPFDHLLFTGSTAVGKKVMRAAAENLTPVTLELGGKSPTIVDESANLADAAERIAFAKLLNAGQFCVAPDYILLPKQCLNEFIVQLRQVLQRFQPTLADNPDCTWIINQQHQQRLRALVEDAQIKGAKLTSLHAEQAHERNMPLLVLTEVTDCMRVMQEEIFGPVLPIMVYEDFYDAVAYVQQRPRPLALYFFSHNKERQQHILAQTHAGGTCINEALLHVAQPDLPFGGIGSSGIGSYHGREGFLTFSHAKAVLTKSRINPMRLIYPPYGGRFQRIIEWLFLRR